MRRDGPTVSIVIPAYNYARYLPQAIDSVLAQTYPAHELIVVDDGSTDDSREVLARYGSRIRVIHQENQGVSVASNAGAAVATGELLAFLDADDYWLRHKLERQVGRFLSEPGLGLVHCGMEEVDPDGTVLSRRLDGLEGWVAREMLLFRRGVILGPGSTALIPRATFWAAEGFDPRTSVSQDWDLAYRVACGHRVGFVPEVLVRVRLHGINAHANVRKMEHDMLLAFDKAFATADRELARIRRRAYGNLHMTLAGCYLWAGECWQCLRHVTKGLALTPDNATRILAFPARWWRRRHLSTGKFRRLISGFSADGR